MGAEGARARARARGGGDRKRESERERESMIVCVRAYKRTLKHAANY